jgi:hypothetical protein
MRRLARSQNAKQYTAAVIAFGLVAYYLFSHDLLYFVSLLAELLRTLGIALLVLRVTRKTQSVSGLSLKTQQLYGAVFVTRLMFKVVYEQDYLYAMIETGAMVRPLPQLPTLSLPVVSTPLRRSRCRCGPMLRPHSAPRVPRRSQPTSSTSSACSTMLHIRRAPSPPPAPGKNRVCALYGHETVTLQSRFCGGRGARGARDRAESPVQEDNDSFNSLYLVGPCLLVALILHPNVTGSWLINVLWAFSTYLEALALIPQLFVFHSASRTVDNMTSLWIVSLFISRVLECSFWFVALFFRGYMKIWSSIVWYVVVTEAVHTLLLFDFVRNFYKCYQHVFSPPTTPADPNCVVPTTWLERATHVGCGVGRFRACRSCCHRGGGSRARTIESLARATRPVWSRESWVKGQCKCRFCNENI